MDTLYQLWRHHHNPASIAQAPWIQSLANFENFKQTYCPEASPYSLAYISRHLSVFVTSKVHPSKYYQIHEGLRVPTEVNTYMRTGSWFPLPSNQDSFISKKYVDFAVLQEAVLLQKSGFDMAPLVHDSGSAALDGIFRQGGILSASEAKRVGEKIKTGEHTSYVSADDGRPVTGTLGNVYASCGGFSGSYNITRWFDEFAVSFGIDRKLQDEFLKRNYSDRRFMFDLPPGIVSFGGEGELLGPRVPLENIRYVICPALYKDDVIKMLSDRGIKIPVVSEEALELLQSERKTIERLAQLQVIDQKAALATIESMLWEAAREKVYASQRSRTRHDFPRFIEMER